MRNILLSVLVALFFTGCASVKLLGTHERRDGSIKEFVQATTDLEYGPAMRIVEGIVYDKVVDEDGKVSYINPRTETRYSASGNGIINSLVDNSVPAAIKGFTGIQAAKARKPNRTTVTQSGGGASATGGSGGDSSASATATGGESESYYEGDISSSSSSESSSESSSDSSSESFSESSSESSSESFSESSSESDSEGGGCQGNCGGGNNGNGNGNNDD